MIVHLRAALLSSLCLAFACGVRADDTPSVDGNSESGESASGESEGAADFFESLDRNEDGKLTLDEIPEGSRDRIEAIFVRLGKNSLTADELAEVRRLASRERRELNRAALFARLDRDGDGSLQVSEVPEQARPLVTTLLERAGKPTDGKLSRAEYDALVKPADDTDVTPAETKGPALLQTLDADGDGRLSPDELAKAASKFAELDANGDGVLQTNELFATGAETSDEESRRPRAEYIKRVYEGLDENEDGSVTVGEAKKAAPLVAENFDRIDTDGDGKISLEEFTASIPKSSAAKLEPPKSDSSTPESDLPRPRG